MKTFLNKQKIISSFLIISIFFSLSPIFAIRTYAVADQAVDKGASAAIITAAEAVSVAAPPCPLLLGTGILCVSDPGVRFNTLSMLSSSLGLTPGTAMKESVWDSIAYFAGRLLLRQISQSIVNWINSGFQGNPSFIQDPEKFMTDTVDRTIGEFIFASDLKFLCDPFETRIRINLGMLYQPFKDRINCTLTGVLQNVDQSVTQAYKDFMNGDFINGGGWDSWLNITTIPQNNQMGAMIIAQSELDARIGDKQIAKRDELNWSGGLLSMKKCTQTTLDMDGNEVKSDDYTGDPYYYNPLATGQTVGATSTSYEATSVRGGTELGSTRTDCQVVTPGVWITGTGNKVLGLELDKLGAADEINEIVGALANFVISKVMQKGMALIKGEELSPNDANWRAGIAALQAQQNNDTFAAGSNSSYTPDYSSYTGSGATYTDDIAFNSAKTSLKTFINSLKVPEQAYYDAYNYINNAATVMETKFLGVISCYQTKLNSTSLNLTVAERNTANTQINTASTTASTMTNIKRNIAPYLISSQANLTALSDITGIVDTTTSLDVLDAQEASLNSLMTGLHTSDQAAKAQETSASTTAQIITNGPVGDVMQAQCNAFPVR